MIAILRLATIALAIALAAMVVHAQLNAIDGQADDSYRRELRRLQAADAMLSGELLKSKAGLVTHYDTLAWLLADLRKRRGVLESPPPFLTDKSELLLVVGRYGQLLESEAQLFEAFKTDNAILRNSVRVFPTMALKVADNMAAHGEGAQLAVRIDELRQDVVMFELFREAQTLRLLRDQINELKSKDLSWLAPPAPRSQDSEPTSRELERELFHTMLKHADVIVTRQPLVDSHVEQVVTLPTADQIAEMQLAYTRGHDLVFRASQRHRLNVFGLALAVVLCGAAWIILRLQLAARALGSATADLTAANAQLNAEQKKTRELADLKSQFVSMTSHEFRTPLSAILSSAELLEAYGERWSAHKKGEHLTRVKDSARRMKEMLDDVLLVGKADAGMLEFKPRPVDLDAWAAELVDRTNEQYEATHSVVYSSSGDLNVVVDDRLLTHVIGNLMSNAIKYSPRGGTVKFALRRARDEVELEVADEGIGISKADQEGLFETFHRGNNVGNVPGTGLGLAIVKRALEVQGGRIEVDSELGRGTRFVVSVPASADQGDA